MGNQRQRGKNSWYITLVILQLSLGQNPRFPPIKVKKKKLKMYQERPKVDYLQRFSLFALNVYEKTEVYLTI